MANENLYEKLDSGLIMALRAYESNPADQAEDDGISVTLRFQGDLAAIEALGFETNTVSDDEARGIVRFKDIPALVAHPGVLWIAAGRKRRPHLEVGPQDVRARASTAGNVGTDGLWHAASAVAALTQVGNATGAGVFVGIIDTGIDFTHPMFMSQVTPTKVTRIFRIWDQGLPPAALTDCPAQSLIQAPGRYGVEFDRDEINLALNGGPAVAHRDCEGHGTHCAGIAAGGTQTADAAVGGDLTKIGVAPEAELIVVKFLDVPDVIRFRTAGGFGAQVSPDDRFKDAILYCLRTARAEGKPIVLSLSFGNDHLPGDALDTDARWVDQTMDPSHAEDDDHFPRGAIIVKSSGNTGDTGDRTVARIVFPPGAASSITVPLELVDDPTRVTSLRFNNCVHELHHPDLFVSFWYRRNFDNVKFAVKLPLRDTFAPDGDMGVGGNFDHGLGIRAGTPPVLVFIPITPRTHRVSFFHGGDNSVPHPSGGTVRRHEAFLSVTPKVVGTDVTYLEGIYEVRITAPGDTEVFVMGDATDWGATLATFSIASTMANGDPLDPAVTAGIIAEFSATDTLGAHAITVAAYDDRNTIAGADHPIADFSSRGPLRDFSDPPGSKPLVADKPDIAAPGVDINSAQGVDTDVGVGIRVAPWTDGVRFIELSGTSMATPMVAGVVALMLDKNATLNTNDVRSFLRVRPGTNPASPGTAHDRAYGRGMVAALETHTATT